jgi:hypothetical protein
VHDCPVLQEAENVLNLSTGLNLSYRRLRKKLHQCRHCKSQGQCPALDNYRKLILQAIAEVAEEMHLVP